MFSCCAKYILKEIGLNAFFLKKKRGVTFAPEKEVCKSSMALRMLDYLMKEDECQKLLMHTAKPQLIRLTAILHNVMVRMTDNAL